MRVLFAHGFEGSPDGSKPTYMRDALGWDVTSPKMSELGWSIASQTDVLIQHLDEEEFDLIVGSSMGGLAAANASSMRPGLDIRLLLMAPAFGLADNWEGMGESGKSAWEITGERRYTGFEMDILLPWEFMESAEKMSWPKPAHPTAIMHGLFDEAVPISFSRRVVEECSNVTLHEVEDNHRLKESMRFISAIASDLMGEGSDEGTKILEELKKRSAKNEDKLEEPEQLSKKVSEVGEQSEQSDGGNPIESLAEQKSDEAERDIEHLQAEMKKLEAQMAQKKEVLQASKEEARVEQEAREKIEAKEEKARMGAEAKEAIKKAEEKVLQARAEAEEAIKRAEAEEAEAEEARMMAELEEEEAKEAKALAEAAKKKVEEAVRKVEEAGRDVEQFTAEEEKEKREEAILERIGQRSEQINWSKIGKSNIGEEDDLTLINGIDEFNQRKLNALGIKTFAQISKIDGVISEAVNDALEFMPGKVTEMAWTSQAITMLELKGVDESSSKVDDGTDDGGITDLSAQINWTLIGEAGDRKSDDLKKIKGVDDEILKKLKLLGIRTFDQISKMDKDTAEAVNGALGFVSGRVSKMMWSQQAMALLEE